MPVRRGRHRCRDALIVGERGGYGRAEPARSRAAPVSATVVRGPRDHHLARESPSAQPVPSTEHGLLAAKSPESRAGRTESARSGVSPQSRRSRRAPCRAWTRAKRARSTTSRPRPRTVSRRPSSGGRVGRHRRPAPEVQSSSGRPRRTGSSLKPAGNWTPRRVDDAKAGKSPPAPGREGESATPGARELERHPLPVRAPGQQEQQHADLDAVEDEKQPKKSVGAHGAGDCSGSALPAAGPGRRRFLLRATGPGAAAAARGRASGRRRWRRRARAAARPRCWRDPLRGARFAGRLGGGWRTPSTIRRTGGRRTAPGVTGRRRS